MTAKNSPINKKSAARFGARRSCGTGITSPSPELERVWDAVGLAASVGTGTEPAENAFDALYPWGAMRRCTVSSNGDFRVLAYEGESGYAADGSAGSVAVEIPLFYMPPRFPGDGYEYWGVSAVQHPGWEPAPAFVTADGSLLPAIYIGAYEASASDGLLRSVSGVYPLVEKTLPEFRTMAEAGGAQLYDYCCQVTLETLFAVEFATLYSNRIMSGACRMPYSNLEEDTIRNDEDGNRAVVSPKYADEFVLGQTVGIGLKRGRNQITAARTVTAIHAESGEIFFDGEALPIRKGQFIYNQGWKTGSTDGVAASSGSPVSNNSGKYCCLYRGIENLWGNLYDWVDGCQVLDHKIYVCTNPALYGGSVTENYTALSYETPRENGFPTELGYDAALPWVRLPSAVGGDRESYTTDFFYQGDGQTTLRCGGHWGTPNASGLFSYAPCSPNEYAGTAITGRLAWRRYPR